jgi:hypothetical protein
MSSTRYPHGLAGFTARWMRDNGPGTGVRPSAVVTVASEQEQRAAWRAWCYPVHRAVGCRCEDCEREALKEPIDG